MYRFIDDLKKLSAYIWVKIFQIITNSINFEYFLIFKYLIFMDLDDTTYSVVLKYDTSLVYFSDILKQVCSL